MEREYTKKEKVQTWFYYYKWWLLLALVLIVCLTSVILDSIGPGKPDYEFAYVGSAYLPEDSVRALEAAVAKLGQDVNGDGKVLVSLHQFITSGAPETDSGLMGGTMSLMANLINGSIYFFLLEDPQGFQDQYQILANPDGSAPGEWDFSIENKALLWTDCPVLANFDLGSYQESRAGERITGDSQQVFSKLYFARRGYYDGYGETNPVENAALWTQLVEGAQFK